MAQEQDVVGLTPNSFHLLHFSLNFHFIIIITQIIIICSISPTSVSGLSSSFTKNAIKMVPLPSIPSIRPLSHDLLIN